LNRICAALGRALIVGVAALGVGVAGDDKGAALQFANVALGLPELI
jgi:hypothetical protein